MATRLPKKERMRLQREKEIREKACEGKDAFPTEAAAMGYRTHVLQKRGRNRGMAAMSAYRCTFCDEWHLGHQS